ncbi:MAG: ECF transporter S component [[Clostridium] scindens]
MAMLAGPWPAAVTGILTNLCMGITDNPTLIPFAITSAACGIAAGLFARKKWFSAQKWKLIIIVLVLDLVTICTASPITIFAFGGVSGNGGQSVAIAGLLASGANIIAAVVGTDFWINLIDRALAMVIAFAVVKVIPDRTLIKYSLGANFTKKKSE